MNVLQGDLSQVHGLILIDYTLDSNQIIITLCQFSKNACRGAVTNGRDIGLYEAPYSDPNESICKIMDPPRAISLMNNF